MKFIILLIILLAHAEFVVSQPKVIEWVTTTEQKPWVNQPEVKPVSREKNIDVIIDLSKTQQVIEGFGSCFNELGWTSLALLEKEDREEVMKELFAPGIGANFTICRMPIGANDFSLNWYSYDETEGDFAMESFSLDNDEKTLIPFIKNAKKYNPELKIWASPWSPPSWMKYNKHYASRSSARMNQMIEQFAEQRREHEEVNENVGAVDQFKTMLDPKYQNDLPIDREGKEGTDMFIQENKYMEAYVLYFSKFIEEYRKEGINIFAVMPQNEFNSAQTFPSCCWTAAGLAKFIGSYLGPVMEAQGVDIYFGTMERANEALVDTILKDEKSSKYIKGVGFQWAGKDALPGIHQQYPNLKYFQTEQECGDGKNDWKGAMYSWNLMKHYLNNGVSVYDYWNTSLLEGGISRWGWAQNSLVVVDADNRIFSYTSEYYIMKHVSHYVQPGARKLETSGRFTDIMAFLNPDNRIVIVTANQEADDKSVNFKIDDTIYSIVMKANSMNTFLLE